MKIKFEISEQWDSEVGGMVPTLLVVMKGTRRGFGGEGITSEVIAKAPNCGMNDHQIAEWATKTVASMLRPLVPADSQLKED